MLSTGFMGAELADIPIGGTVAVIALGPVGLMAVAGARLRGAGLVIGVDSVPARQQLARIRRRHHSRSHEGRYSSAYLGADRWSGRGFLSRGFGDRHVLSDG